MRLIHTADWHLGSRLYLKDRTPEIEFALDELLNQAKNLDVDAVLVAGDIFETPNPTNEAERIAYQFFYRLREAQIPAVVIAGNHDSAFRIDSVANLLQLADVYALGKPRLSEDGGVITLNTKSGKLKVGAMPFASERRLLDPDELWNKDEKEQRDGYREIVAELLRDLASGFNDDSVNIIMAHLTIDSARLANSERQLQSQGIYALSGQSLPAHAQYIALGHIHKHQKLQLTAPAYYSGSLIQIDFGEAEEEKGFYLIDVKPGLPATVEFKQITCLKPLKQIECDIKDLDDQLEEHRNYPGYLKVIVNLPKCQTGLADKVRKICPSVIQVEPRYPKSTLNNDLIQSPTEFNPTAEYTRYYQERFSSTPETAVIEKFEELYKQELEHASS